MSCFYCVCCIYSYSQCKSFSEPLEQVRQPDIVYKLITLSLVSKFFFRITAYSIPQNYWELYFGCLVASHSFWIHVAVRTTDTWENNLISKYDKQTCQYDIFSCIQLHRNWVRVHPCKIISIDFYYVWLCYLCWK